MTAATEGVTRASRVRAEAMAPGERRSMIVEAMLPLLLEHGEMVTTRQVAEAAAIAEGTIFRVFADKDELIAAVVELAADRSAIEEALARSTPAIHSSRWSPPPWVSFSGARSTSPV